MKQDNAIYFQLDGTKKQGKERAIGILKNLSKGRPKIIFPWVQTYQVEHLETNWFAYKINN